MRVDSSAEAPGASWRLVHAEYHGPAWRRAKKLGVRFAPLGDWIDSKERVYGEAP